MNPQQSTNLLTISDKSSDLVWVTDEASRKLQMAALHVLLDILIKRGSRSVLLCRGVHHVLNNQKEDGFNDLIKTLIKALELESGETPGR